MSKKFTFTPIILVCFFIFTFISCENNLTEKNTIMPGEELSNLKSIYKNSDYIIIKHNKIDLDILNRNAKMFYTFMPDNLFSNSFIDSKSFDNFYSKYYIDINNKHIFFETCSYT